MSNGATTRRNRSAWLRFRKSKGALAGLAILIVMAATAYFAPVIANNRPIVARCDGRLYFPAIKQLFPFKYFAPSDPISRKLMNDPQWLERGAYGNDVVTFKIMPPAPWSPYQTDLGAIHHPPGLAGRHFLGCDDEGRDVFARLVYGTKVSLLVGFLAVGVASLIGLVLGGAAGFFGGWLDFLLVSRLIEVMMCFPTFFFILTVVAVMDPRYLNVWTIMLIIGLTSWPSTARYARAEFMRLKEMEFVVAARSLGAGSLRVAVKHILPGAMTPILINAVFGIAGAILLEAALSFLGVGVQPPEPSWGNVLSEVTRYWNAWWMGVFPGAAIFLAVLSYNLVGDGVRDALDPGFKKRSR